MTPKRPVLGLVPARGGSKGIVGKNMRLIGGDPMIAHTLRAARDSGVIDRLVVSTEGNEIAQWCKLHGFEVLDRPEELAGDEITIAQVARHVIDELDWDGILVALLPTSPLRGPEAIRRAVERAQAEDIDSLASVVRQPKLFWFDESDGLDDPKPLYAARVNRQYGKHGVLQETGAILLVTTDALRKGGEMVGERHKLFELSHDEGIDIDSYDDLTAARRIAEQGRIVFRISANWEVGSGHLLELPGPGRGAERARLRLPAVEVRPVRDRDARRARLPVDPRHDDLRDRPAGAEERPEAQPASSTTCSTPPSEDVLLAADGRLPGRQRRGPRPRRALADWVVNALYPPATAPTRATSPAARSGRDAARRVPQPAADSVIRARPGADPDHLRRHRPVALLRPLRDRAATRRTWTCEIRVILGPGAEEQEFPPEIVPARRHVPSMAAEMLAADLAITAAGRTVYEAAMTGTPVVALAAERPRGDARAPRARRPASSSWASGRSSTATSSCPSCGACWPTTSCARISASACGSRSTPWARSASHTKSAD